MLSRCADIRQVKHRFERQLILNADVVGVCRRNLPFVVDGDQAGRGEQHLSCAYILHPPEEESRLESGRRILHQIEDRVALRAVVESSRAAAHHQSLIAEHVISEAEARRVVNSAIAIESLLYSLPRLKHPL